MRLAALAILVACRAPGAAQSLLSECACPCPDDAPVADAAPDAPPAINLTTPWARTALVPSTPTLRGADGVARDDQGCWVVPWEESGSVIRACPSGEGYVHETVASGLNGPEDAKPGHLDGDEAVDIAIALDGGSRVMLAFGGGPVVTLSESQSTGRVMQVAIADVDADGHQDVLYGSRASTAARIAWCRNPGGADARIGLLWTCRTITAAGWAMSVIPRDVNGDARMDVVVSDRAKIGAADWSLYGARWAEQLGDGTWLNHPISLPAGSCSPYSSTACTKTPGDEMFAAVDGSDVIDCTSTASQPDSRVTVHSTSDWLSWTHVTLPPAPNVGHCQGVLPMDVDSDGDRDLVVTTWKANALPVAPADAGKSGAYWLRNDGTTWARGEISGDAGAKYDNAVRDGPCIVTTEQLGEPVGGLGLVRLCPPGAT